MLSSTLLGDLGYDDLEVADGGTASTMLEKLILEPETFAQEERLHRLLWPLTRSVRPSGERTVEVDSGHLVYTPVDIEQDVN